jgi:hypothetical protein
MGAILYLILDQMVTFDLTLEEEKTTQQQQHSIKEFLIGITSSGISYENTFQIYVVT